jgi:hypothetical protein
MRLSFFHHHDQVEQTCPRHGWRRAPLLITSLVYAGVFVGATAGAASATSTQGTTTATPRSGISSPASSSGCTLSLTPVCIYVNGTGLHVNYVTATGYPDDENGCVTGELTANGSLYAVTNPVCWSDEIVVLNSYYSVNANFSNGTQLCVKYVGPGAPDGAACETVES